MRLSLRLVQPLPQSADPDVHPSREAIYPGSARLNRIRGVLYHRDRLALGRPGIETLHEPLTRV
jgi:hypothetical protein